MKANKKISMVEMEANFVELFVFGFPLVIIPPVEELMEVDAEVGLVTVSFRRPIPKGLCGPT